MKLIKLRKTYREIPERWDEVTRAQLVRIMEILYCSGYVAEQQILRLLQVLTGMSNFQFFRCKVEELEEYFYLLEFVLRDKLTLQLLPLHGEYHGPSDRCANLIYDEFVYSEHFYMQWATKRESEDLLNNLVATLYRPIKKCYDLELDPDGDARIPFNEHVIAWHAKNAVAYWPKAVKLAVAHFYAGCRQKWVEDNPDIFGGSGEPARYGLLSVMNSVALEGGYGDFEKVGKTNINTILMALNEAVDQAKRIEKASKA